MENIEKRKPVLSCVILFAICGLARLIEYFLIKIILKKQKSVGKMENIKYINALDDSKSPMLQWHAIRGNEERLFIY